MDALDRVVCQQNIARYRELLELEADPVTRQKLAGLIAEEEAKLTRPHSGDR